jgi:uncharacterized protein (TIGR03435 family)
MAVRCVVTCVLLAVAPPIAQTLLRFEVASIRPVENTGVIGLRLTGSQVRISGYSLHDYISIAYAVELPQVIVPEWARQQRYEIAANLPSGATREQVPQMLQALLAERFQLKVHRESREFPVYALTVGKGGLKIKGTPVDPNAVPKATELTGGGTNAGVVINLGAGTFSVADDKLVVTQLTMAEVAGALTRFSERKTIDATGLTDRFDFTLDLSHQDYQFVMMRAAINNGYPVSSQGLTMLDGAPANVLGQYLSRTGLELQERRMPLDVIVVDSSLKVPTDN